MSRAATITSAVVDIGNSAAKVSQLENDLPKALHTYALQDLRKLVTEQLPGEIGSVIIGNSGEPALAEDLAAQVFARGGEAVVLSRDCALPFRSLYAAGQAGVDRLANVAAALHAETKGPVIIVDAGSAITVEMVGARDVFYGGVILPGLSLQAASLNRGTASLPLVERSAIESAGAGSTGHLGLPATDTGGAIAAGIFAAATGGVEKVISTYFEQREMTGANVIFTGGDGELLLKKLSLSPSIKHAALTGSVVTFDPLLTLRGLALLGAAQ